MKRKLRIPLLLLGVYLIFMGIAEIIMSRWTEPAETTRRLLGIACACLGLAAIWDGCREVLIPRKKREEPVQPKQVILPDVDGRRRSDVSRETLQQQLALLAERGASFSLEILPVPEIPGLGWLEKALCTYEESIRISALFVTGERCYAIIPENTNLGMLGVCCLLGWGCAQDPVRGRTLLTLPYCSDSRYKFYGLGRMYAEGIRVPEDIEKGVRYLQKAGDYEPAREALKQYKKSIFGVWRRRRR